MAYQLRPSPGPVSIDSLNVQIGDASEKGFESEVVERQTSLDEDIGAVGPASPTRSDGGGAGGDAESPMDTNYAAELYKIPEFAELGSILKSFLRGFSEKAC